MMWRNVETMSQISDMDYILISRLMPYLDEMRKFWANVKNINVLISGEHKVEGVQDMYYRVTSTPTRSPIKNVQVFPYIPTAVLGMANGYQQILAKLCCDKSFRFEEFTILVKSGIPTMCQRGQWLTFIPTDILNQDQDRGTWVYLTKEEMKNLCITDGVYNSVKQKVIRYF